MGLISALKTQEYIEPPVLEYNRRDWMTKKQKIMQNPLSLEHFPLPRVPDDWHIPTNSHTKKKS